MPRVLRHIPQLLLLTGIAALSLVAIARADGYARVTVRATIIGSNAPDRLSGTDGADVISGLGGHDMIRGRRRRRLRDRRHRAGRDRWRAG